MRLGGKYKESNLYKWRLKNGRQPYDKPKPRTPARRERDSNWQWRKTISKYGLTEDQYNILLEAQGGRCAICKQTQERRLVVDHDHATARVRGLLCDSCNLGLGKFKDNAEWLQEAARYVTMDR